MEVVSVDVTRPDPALVSRMVQCLRAGEVVAGPSDTVYGFLARPSMPQAMETLRRLKGREGPYILLVSGWEMAKRATQDVTEATWARIRQIWPGPVTVVLPGTTGQSVALRMPKTTLLIAILENIGEPLISTSANRAGEPAPMLAEEVLGAFAHENVPLLLDGGPATSREPSTLVDLTGSHARILRKGQGDAAPLLDPPSGTP